ncbi:hypothetical protein AVEN_164580-1 [Araneus ventricosus]|uniref:Uncharacterized protein n=1 Tax=Araneus ventricosus TaxID=182803 RepID=A0A4Y2B4N5_ARAVE|nr:hypothetical protein AVEN_164580-1 [Araneus ventricosus]
MINKLSNKTASNNRMCITTSCLMPRVEPFTSNGPRSIPNYEISEESGASWENKVRWACRISHLLLRLSYFTSRGRDTGWYLPSHDVKCTGCASG